MKQLLDFLPLIIFFGFYKTYDIFVATKSLIIATAVVLIFTWIKYRKVEKMTIITFVMVAIFGTLTIVFHNADFIIWKVTILNGLFALALLITPLFIKQTLIERMLGGELKLPANIWQHLNIVWALFFIICAMINLYVGFKISEAAWMSFKTFVFPIATFVLTLASGAYIYRYLPKDEDKTEDQ